MVCFQAFADILCRALDIGVVIVKNTTPITIEEFANEFSAVETQGIQDDILRMQMVCCSNGFTEFFSPVQGSMLHKKSLFQMYDIRPTDCFFYGFSPPIGIVIIEFREQRLNNRELEVRDFEIRVFSVWIFEIRPRENTHFFACIPECLNRSTGGFVQSVSLTEKVIDDK